MGAVSPYILVSPDPFATSFDEVVRLTKAPKGGSRLGASNVRRPTMGLELKGDRYAYLRVTTPSADGVTLLVDAGAEHDALGKGKSATNSNFLIQSVSESREEKTQLTQTFGVPVIFLYGEQARTIQVQGVLLNTDDFNWRAEWWENYNNYLRGTKCVESGSRVTLSWDDIVVQGYILNASAQETSQEQNFVTFTFSMVLTAYQNISNIGDVAGAHGDIAQAYEIDVGNNRTMSGLIEENRGRSQLAEFDLRVRLLRQALGSTSSGAGSTFGKVMKGLNIATSLAQGVASAVGGGKGAWGLADSLATGAINSAVGLALSQLGGFYGSRTVRVPQGAISGSAFYDSAYIDASNTDALELAGYGFASNKTIPGYALAKRFDPGGSTEFARPGEVLTVNGTKRVGKTYSDIVNYAYKPVTVVKGSHRAARLSDNIYEYVARAPVKITRDDIANISPDFKALQRADEALRRTLVARLFKEYLGPDVPVPSLLSSVLKAVAFVAIRMAARVVTDRLHEAFANLSLLARGNQTPPRTPAARLRAAEKFPPLHAARATDATVPRPSVKGVGSVTASTPTGVTRNDITRRY